MSMEHEAAKVVSEILHKYGVDFSDSVARAEAKQDCVREIVNRLGILMRVVSEQQVRSSGWLPPADADEQAVRRTHAGIADYCRQRRLAIEESRDMIMLGTSWSGLMVVLGLDEAHHRRLARGGT